MLNQYNFKALKSLKRILHLTSWLWWFSIFNNRVSFFNPMATFFCHMASQISVKYSVQFLTWSSQNLKDFDQIANLAPLPKVFWIQFWIQSGFNSGFNPILDYELLQVWMIALDSLFHKTKWIFLQRTSWEYLFGSCSKQFISNLESSERLILATSISIHHQTPLFGDSIVFRNVYGRNFFCFGIAALCPALPP